MATIERKLKAGVRTGGYQARIRRKGYPTQVKTFTKKKDAEAWVRKIEAQMDQQVWKETTLETQTTLLAALERYETEVTPQKKGAKQELGVIRQWKPRKIAQKFLFTIRNADLAEVVQEMREEKKSGATMRLHLALLYSLYSTARRDWGMDSLVSPKVTSPAIPGGRTRRLVDDEASKLLDACAKTSKQLVEITEFAIETAMRQGEILGMEWPDIDLEARTVYLITTKNGDSRTVPLTTRATDILKKRLVSKKTARVWEYTCYASR
jgi:integrase